MVDDLGWELSDSEDETWQIKWSPSPSLVTGLVRSGHRSTHGPHAMNMAVSYRRVMVLVWGFPIPDWFPLIKQLRDFETSNIDDNWMIMVGIWLWQWDWDYYVWMIMIGLWINGWLMDAPHGRRSPLATCCQETEKSGRQFPPWHTALRGIEATVVECKPMGSDGLTGWPVDQLMNIIYS